MEVDPVMVQLVSKIAWPRPPGVFVQVGASFHRQTISQPEEAGIDNVDLVGRYDVASVFQDRFINIRWGRIYVSCSDSCSVYHESASAVVMKANPLGHPGINLQLRYFLPSVSDRARFPTFAVFDACVLVERFRKIYPESAA